MNKKSKTFLLSLKATLQGGNRYTPIDLDNSIIAGETIRINEPFSVKGDDIFFINMNILIWVLSYVL